MNKAETDTSNMQEAENFTLEVDFCITIFQPLIFSHLLIRLAQRFLSMWYTTTNNKYYLLVLNFFLFSNHCMFWLLVGVSPLI